LSCDPVAVVQNTFPHKKYTENTKKQYIEHKNLGRVRAVPSLGEICPGICITTEDKTRKNLSQGTNSQNLLRIYEFLQNIHINFT
jgi:hypothetical protein